MKKIYLYAGIITAITTFLTGCVDNDYDLADIDTTTLLKVDNLVLPVNIESITLNDIFDIKADSKIQPITIDGKEFYAVTEHGDINSESINIPVFSVTTPQINPSQANFDLIPANQTRSVGTVIKYDYSLRDFAAQDVKLVASGIDDAVISLDNLQSTPTPVKIELTATNIPNYATVSFPELRLMIVKGLEFANLPSTYKYNKATGEMLISDLKCINNTATISATLSGIDLTLTDTSISNGTFTLSDDIDLVDGILRAEIDLGMTPDNYVPSTTVSFTVTSSIGDFNATHVSGVVEYKLTGDQLNIAPIDLSGIPDFLNQEGTDIKLANPQIYLNLNNPVAPYNLYYQTGIRFTALRSSGSESFSPDNNALISTRANFAGPYNFLLSPSLTTPLPEYSANLEHIPFSGLSNLLSGDGLPETIEINLINPGLPRQKVVNFELGNDIAGISGSYDFIAPIALKDGSKIIYSETKNGWADDDLDKLTIELLSVEADVTSTIPMDATLTAYPLDINGDLITSSKAEITIPANATNKHIVITMQGPIKDLDGITFTAVLSPGSEEALSPLQTITLNNLKAKVSGTYLLTDDDN